MTQWRTGCAASGATGTGRSATSRRGSATPAPTAKRRCGPRRGPSSTARGRRSRSGSTCASRWGRPGRGSRPRQIEREAGVTYKTAWRMCHLVRAALAEGADECALFSGTVEVDETYVGARKPRDSRASVSRDDRRPEDKQPVVGIVQRGGGRPGLRRPPTSSARPSSPSSSRHTPVGSTRLHGRVPGLQDAPEGRGTRTTWCATRSSSTRRRSWTRRRGRSCPSTRTRLRVSVPTSKGRRVPSTGAWSRFYLQRYVDELAFRYSHRADDRPMVLTMIGRAARSARPSVRPAGI